MVALLEMYDLSMHRPVYLGDSPATTTSGSVARDNVVDFVEYRAQHEQSWTGLLAAVPSLPAGLRDQDLSAEDGEQLERMLEGRAGLPTRPARTIPRGDISMLLRRQR